MTISNQQLQIAVGGLLQDLGHSYDYNANRDQLTPQRVIQLLDTAPQAEGEAPLQASDFQKLNGPWTYSDITKTRQRLATIFTYLEENSVLEGATNIDLNAFRDSIFSVGQSGKLNANTIGFGSYGKLISTCPIKGDLDATALIFLNGQNMWNSISQDIPTEPILGRLNAESGLQRCLDNGGDEKYGEGFCNDMNDDLFEAPHFESESARERARGHSFRVATGCPEDTRTEKQKCIDDGWEDDLSVPASYADVDCSDAKDEGEWHECNDMKKRAGYQDPTPGGPGYCSVR